MNISDYEKLNLSRESKKCNNCGKIFKETNLPISYVLALQGKNLLFCQNCLEQAAYGIPECAKAQAIANAQLIATFYKDIPPRVGHSSLQNTLKQFNYYSISSNKQVKYLKALCSRPSPQAIIDSFGNRRIFLKELQDAPPLSDHEKNTLPYVKIKQERRKLSVKKMNLLFQEVLEEISQHNMFLEHHDSKNMKFTLTHCQNDLENILLNLVTKLRKICIVNETPHNIWNILFFFEYLLYKNCGTKDFSHELIAKSIDLSQEYIYYKFNNFDELYTWYIQLRILDEPGPKYVQDILHNQICHAVLQKTMNYIINKLNFDVKQHIKFHFHKFQIDIKEQYTATIESDFCFFYENKYYILMNCVFLISCRLIKAYSKYSIKFRARDNIEAIKRLHYSLWLDDFEKSIIMQSKDVNIIKEESNSINIQKIAGENPFYLYNSMDFQDSFSNSTNQHHFTTKLTGINYANDDGTNRKKLLLDVPDRMNVNLVREIKNPYDNNAIAVYSSNNMLGYIPKEIAREVAKHLDNGFTYSASLFINRFDTRTGEFIKNDNLPQLEYTSISTKLTITISEEKILEAKIIW